MNIRIEEKKKINTKVFVDILEDAPQEAIDATLKDFKQRAPGWIAKEVTKVYAIKSSDVKPGGTAGNTRPVIKGNSAYIEYTGRTLTPIHFKMSTNAKRRKLKKYYRVPERMMPNGNKYTTMTENTYYTTKVSIFKGRTKRLWGKYEPPIFMAGVKGGYLPFQRIKNDSKQFVSVRTTSLPQMVQHKKVKEGIEENVMQNMQKRFEHNLDRYLSKHFK